MTKPDTNIKHHKTVRLTENELLRAGWLRAVRKKDNQVVWLTDGFDSNPSTFEQAQQITLDAYPGKYHV